jgi:hypothetical protein
MRPAAFWFAAAILVALAALVLGVPLNSGAGLLLALLWLIGVWKLATVRQEDQP